MVGKQLRLKKRCTSDSVVLLSVDTVQPRIAIHGGTDFAGYRKGRYSMFIDGAYIQCRLVKKHIFLPLLASAMQLRDAATRKMDWSVSRDLL